MRLIRHLALGGLFAVGLSGCGRTTVSIPVEPTSSAEEAADTPEPANAGDG